ncbi:MAG: cell wall-binding repeat-containing protein, partial [Actinomycetota bacterium]|nr:cell wall-binding repeat-containing protein [Actinomycetota bacterium]
DAFETAEDAPLVVAAPGVLANDTDADGDGLTAIKVTGPAHGTLSLAANGSFTYTPVADYNGSDSFQYRANDGTADSNVVAVTLTVTPVDDPEPLPPIIPIEGATRFDTAVAASKEAYPDGLDPLGARTAVIATGRNWPDALGGSSLAGALGGPILLVDTNSVPAAVAAEITRLGADRAIILGGTAAVGASVEAALKTQLGNADVTRIAGTNRYETAGKIAARVIAEQGSGYDGTAFVATGGKFPDALGAAPLAAANVWPLYLANPATGLSAGTKTAMAGVTDVVILGGTGVVSPAVGSYLEATYPSKVTRLAGGDRYETAVKVATYGVDHAGLGWTRVAIATGENFPDA